MKLPVLSMRRRAEVMSEILNTRLETLMPTVLGESGCELWIVLCHEDDFDPVFRTMIPPESWCPILQMLVFVVDRETGKVRRFNISGTDTYDLYERPYVGQLPEKQWPELRRIVEEHDPKRIGINTGSVQWAAGGLTHNLFLQLTEVLPSRFVDRFESAEPLAVRWLATLIPEEIELYEHAVGVAREILGSTLSAETVVPGVTTVDDLMWSYWQRCADNGLETSFKPSFRIHRNPGGIDNHGATDAVVRPGDLIHSDVGIRYLGLNTDHQEWAYVRAGTTDEVPESLQDLMRCGNQLQDVFMAELTHGATGNELLSSILDTARSRGLPAPRVYSHSLGHCLHEPGPLIGLPWEQERCPGRGDVRLEYDTAFAMELSVAGPVSEWHGEEVTLSIEQDVVFTAAGARLLGGRQREFHII